MEEKKASVLLDKVSFFVIVISAFLLPLFFLSSPGVSLDVSKAVLLYPAILLAFALWIMARLVDGNFFIPKSATLLSVFLVSVVFFLSSLVSQSPIVSMIGLGPETGTFLAIALMSIAAFLASLFFQSKNNVFYFYSALLVSFVVAVVFQAIRVLSNGSMLSFGVFADTSGNLVGKWNDFAIFLGFIVTLALSALEFLTISTGLRSLLIAVVVAGLAFLSLVNFSLAWLFTGVFALVLFLYGHYYVSRESGSVPASTGSWFLKTSFFVTIISLFFFFFTLATSQNPLFYRSAAEQQKVLSGEVKASRFEIGQLEVRPSFSGTWDVIKAEKSKSFWLGAGPNRFVNEWLSSKPAGVNESIFWGTDFNFGYGLIPTFAVTTGFLGFLAFLFLIISFVYRGGKAMLSGGLTRVSNFTVASSFLGALYLWVFSLMYVPGVALFTLMFIMTGLAIGVLASEGFVRRTAFNVFSSRVVSFISILVLLLVLMGVLYGGYQLTKRLSSIFSFAEASVKANTGNDLDGAEALLNEAASSAPHDLYFRSMSELQLLKLNVIASKTGTDAEKETLQKNFLDTLGKAIAGAENAIKFDRTNYLNFVALARIYEAILPIVPQNSYDSAYKNARAGYDQALILNPHSPGLYLTEARLEVTHKDLKAVRALLEKALTEKTNYTEAVFLLSQLEATENNIPAAIARAEDAARLAPNEIIIFFQLGLLKYNNRDYKGAVEALERAVYLNNNYSNARYFLGLSYQKLGRTSDAVTQFQRIQELNPDNSEVKQILSNLQAIKDPFEAAPTKPEKRSKLPVQDQN